MYGFYYIVDICVLFWQSVFRSTKKSLGIDAIQYTNASFTHTHTHTRGVDGGG